MVQHMSIAVINRQPGSLIFEVVNIRKPPLFHLSEKNTPRSRIVEKNQSCAKLRNNWFRWFVVHNLSIISCPELILFVARRCISVRDSASPLGIHGIGFVAQVMLLALLLVVFAAAE